MTGVMTADRGKILNRVHDDKQSILFKTLSKPVPLRTTPTHKRDYSTWCYHKRILYKIENQALCKEMATGPYVQY